MAKNEGGGSWYNLLITTYGETIVQNKLNINAIFELIIPSLSFLRSGYYQNAGFADRRKSTNYWTKKINAATTARNLEFSSYVLRPQASYNRFLFGFSLRRVAKPSSLLILFVPKGGRWQEIMEMEAGAIII